MKWTTEKPKQEGYYLFLHHSEATPLVIEVRQGPKGLEAFNFFWKWFEPLYEFPDCTYWSDSKIELPEES